MRKPKSTKGNPLADFKPITSYSYIKSVQLTILVPGCPTLYKSFTAPLTIKPDTGLEIVDKGSSLLPEAPLLPLYEAVRFVDSDHDFQKYDIVTGRGELKKLLSWIMGDVKKEFRIDFELTGTGGLILRRWESTSVRLPGEIMGIQGRVPHFRTNFELSTCYPVRGNQEAVSHVRVISYVLGELRLLVQCEIDGFVLDEKYKAISSGICEDTPKESVSDLAEDILGAGLIITSKKSAPSDSAVPLVVLNYQGFQVEHEDLIELKTRSTRNPSPIKESEIYAQAVWSGTPATILALHERGVFQREVIHKLSELEQMKETKKVRKGVQRVGVLLKEIIKVLKDKPAGARYCLICKGPGERDMDLILKEGGRGAGLTKM